MLFVVFICIGLGLLGISLAWELLNESCARSHSTRRLTRLLDQRAWEGSPEAIGPVRWLVISSDDYNAVFGTRRVMAVEMDSTGKLPPVLCASRSRTLHRLPRPPHLAWPPPEAHSRRRTPP